MELVNAIYLVPRPGKSDTKALSVIREALETTVVLLAPIVPHITEELWQMLGHHKLLCEVSWPAYNESVASEEEMIVVIQINGKLRSRITVPVGEDPEKIKAAALAEEKIKVLIKDTAVKKVIYVPNKLVNIVVTE
jgi:leucyl-tRNA synthetase